MSTYRLPLDLARRRLGQGLGTDPRQRYDINRDGWYDEARALAFGRGLAAKAIVHALHRDAAERSIGQHRWLSKTQAVATGWILCEGAFDHSTGQPSASEVNGLLLARDSRVYAYSANLGRNSDLAARMKHGTTAWGRESLVLPADNTAGVLACRSVTEIQLSDDPLYVDKQIGTIAGSLTVEDLFAGIVVNKQSLREFSGDIPLLGTAASSAIVPVLGSGSPS